MDSVSPTPEIRKSSVRRYAQTAGFLFLFFTILSTVHYSLIDLPVLKSDNTEETALLIESNQFKFRLGILIDLVLLIMGVVLSWCLYVLLKPTHKFLALLAFSLIIVQAALFAMLEVGSFVSLFAANGMGPSGIETEYSLSTLQLALDIRTAGYDIVIFIFAIAFGIYSYLFYRSRCITRVLSVWGMIAFSLMVVAIVIKILVPEGPGILGLVASALVMLFQLLVGFGLLIKGVRVRNA